MIVLYDEQCGFCTWALAWLLRWDRARRLRPVAIQSEEGQARLASLSPELRLASWHGIDEDGRLLSGGAALPALLRSLPGAGPLAALAGSAPDLTDSAYRWVAAHRSQLGRALPAASKRRARGLVAQRMH